MTKTINVAFDDEEHADLVELKARKELTWKGLIMEAARLVEVEPGVEG